MTWETVRKLVEIILAGEDFDTKLLVYEKLLTEGQPFNAWQRAVCLCAIATLEELKQDPKEHLYPIAQRLGELRRCHRIIGFPKEDDLKELESTIKKLR